MLNIFKCTNPGGGGGTDLKGGWGCAAVMTPFFQASRRSLAYQFTIIAPLLCPPFSNFRKNFNFQSCFGQNFSSQDANFPNFRSLDPSFFKENPLPRPYFWKPVWHIPIQKKVECPPWGTNIVAVIVYYLVYNYLEVFQFVTVVSLFKMPEKCRIEINWSYITSCVSCFICLF